MPKPCRPRCQSFAPFRALWGCGCGAKACPPLCLRLHVFHVTSAQTVQLKQTSKMGGSFLGRYCITEETAEEEAFVGTERAVKWIGGRRRRSRNNGHFQPDSLCLSFPGHWSSSRHSWICINAEPKLPSMLCSVSQSSRRCLPSYHLKASTFFCLTWLKPVSLSVYKRLWRKLTQFQISLSPLCSVDVSLFSFPFLCHFHFFFDSLLGWAPPKLKRANVLFLLVTSQP